MSKTPFDCLIHLTPAYDPNVIVKRHVDAGTCFVLPLMHSLETFTGSLGFKAAIRTWYTIPQLSESEP